VGQVRPVKLRFTLPARFELEAVLNYIEDRSPQGAAKVQARIKAVTELLLAHPFMGVATNERGIRRVAVNPYPYAIYYEPLGDKVVIHSIRHGARKGN
jgi:toxin ParE1/3/4